MRHPFRVREVAAQAGLSEATVDRVLHGRPGVRPSTARQVERAVAELHRQADQLELGGRTWVLDVVVQAPLRFSVEVRTAVEAALPALRPAVVRARFAVLEGADPAAVVAALERAARARSDGVVLKAPDAPGVVRAVDRLVADGVPVVTLVTDLPTSARTAYAGLDNRAAGATAAYLLDGWLGGLVPRGGAGAAAGDGAGVLVVRGTGSFRGEDERAAGFRAALAETGRPRPVLEVVDDEEAPAAVADGVRAALARSPGVRALYSMYSGAGGTRAALDAAASAGAEPGVVLAHDLDAEHRALLRRRRLTAVLHHDLRADLRGACEVLVAAHRGRAGPAGSAPPPAGALVASAVQVVTPHNLPR